MWSGPLSSEMLSIYPMGKWRKGVPVFSLDSPSTSELEHIQRSRTPTSDHCSASYVPIFVWEVPLYASRASPAILLPLMSKMWPRQRHCTLEAYEHTPIFDTTWSEFAHGAYEALKWTVGMHPNWESWCTWFHVTFWIIDWFVSKELKDVCTNSSIRTPFHNKT